MAKIRGSIIKEIFRACIKKASTRGDIELSGNIEGFFEFMSKDIEGIIGEKLNTNTLYRRYYYGISNISDSESFSIEKRAIDALTHYAKGKKYSEYIKKYNNTKIRFHISSQYFQLLKKGLVKRLKSNKNLNNTPNKFFGLRYGINPHDSPLYCALIPELTFSIISPNKFDQEYFEDTFNLGQNGQKKRIEDYQKSLLCHALSPFPDTLALLLDIGRFLRLSGGLNLSPNLLLGGIEFGKLNWVVKDFDAKDRLFSSNSFRRKLYKKVGFREDENLFYCEPKNAYSNSMKTLNSDEHEIDTIALSYEALSNFMFGSEYIRKRLTKEEAKFLELKIEEMGNVKTDYLEKLSVFSISTVRDSIDSQFEAIRSVLVHLRRLDKDTFKYYLVQRYNQLKFDDCLKIAIRREHDFDSTFDKIDTLDNIKRRSFSSIYFKDYYFNEDRETVHPYYFPSGNVYTKYSDIEVAKSKVILIIDSREKIESLVSNLDESQIAKILSDLLSFSTYFYKGDHAKLKLIRKLLAVYCEEFAFSWKEYNSHSHAFKHNFEMFSELIFSNVSELSILPFYFYPYIHVELGNGQKMQKIFIELAEIVFYDVKLLY